jgi:hypothetical protein
LSIAIFLGTKEAQALRLGDYDYDLNDRNNELLSQKIEVDSFDERSDN